MHEEREAWTRLVLAARDLSYASTEDCRSNDQYDAAAVEFCDALRALADLGIDTARIVDEFDHLMPPERRRK